MYTTGIALLDALTEANVSYIFANLGSDHPAVIEAIAEAHAAGRKIPQVITCPNEMVGMSAAHGFWQASGAPRRSWCMSNAARKRSPARSTTPPRAAPR